MQPYARAPLHMQNVPSCQAANNSGSCNRAAANWDDILELRFEDTVVHMLAFRSYYSFGLRRKGGRDEVACANLNMGGAWRKKRTVPVEILTRTCCDQRI